jgi:hypothetical protein
MSNNGHFWTVQEQKDLVEDYSKKNEKESDVSWCAKWALKYGRGLSSDAVRSKLKALKNSGVIKDRSPDEPREENSYEQGDDFINIICASKRMLSKEDVLKEFNVDTNIWMVDKYKVKTSEGYRKDRSVEWRVENGTVTYGNVSDSGKMLVVPLYHIEVRLIRKVDEIRAESAVLDIISDAKKYAPKYPKITYPVQRGNMMYEIDMPDIHFGRLSWREESGDDYDIKIAEAIVNNVFDELLSYTRIFPIKKILFPLGNDFFNVNGKANTTVRGTPQQEDTRWQKTFRLGRQLAVGLIEKCSKVAPVDVMIIKGNHDEEKTFYLGDSLFSWFHNNKDVFIDNRAMGRKYYSYGKNLIGFTHGSEEKAERISALMPLEVPDLWAKSKYREFHLGDKHHKIESVETNGVVVRTLRSLVAADAWTFDRGFIGSMRAAQSFLWDAEKGQIGQFTATP